MQFLYAPENSHEMCIFALTIYIRGIILRNMELFLGRNNSFATWGLHSIKQEMIEQLKPCLFRGTSA